MPWNVKRMFLDSRRCNRNDLPKTLNDNGLIPIAEGYSLKEMAYMFGVTWCTMQKWLQRRLIPSVRMLGDTHQERCYRVLHRALMRWIAEHQDYEYVLDRLEGNLDRYEPVTLHQKKQEILRAIARSPRQQIPQNWTPPQPKPEPSRYFRKKAAREALDEAWPW